MQVIAVIFPINSDSAENIDYLCFPVTQCYLLNHIMIDTSDVALSTSVRLSVKGRRSEAFPDISCCSINSLI